MLHPLRASRRGPHHWHLQLTFDLTIQPMVGAIAAGTAGLLPGRELERITAPHCSVGQGLRPESGWVLWSGRSLRICLSQEAAGTKLLSQAGCPVAKMFQGFLSSQPVPFGPRALLSPLSSFPTSPHLCGAGGAGPVGCAHGSSAHSSEDTGGEGRHQARSLGGQSVGAGSA